MRPHKYKRAVRGLQSGAKSAFRLPEQRVLPMSRTIWHTSRSRPRIAIGSVGYVTLYCSPEDIWASSKVTVNRAYNAPPPCQVIILA